MTHLLSLVALFGAAPARAGMVDEPTTLGIPFEEPDDPAAGEARSRARPSARGPSARPSSSRAPARPAARGPRPAPSARTGPGGPAHRPHDGLRPPVRAGVGCPPATCTPSGGRPGGAAHGPGGPSQRPAGGRPTTAPAGDRAPSRDVTRPAGPSTRPGGPMGTRPGGPIGTRPGVARPVVVLGRPVGISRGPRAVRYVQVQPVRRVFVYGPPPATPVSTVERRAPVEAPRRDLPERAVNRTSTLALGAGLAQHVSLGSSGVLADPGVSFTARYRPVETLGFEVGVGHFDGRNSPDEVRSNTNVNGQVKLFAFPWSRVSPYALVGGTYNVANLHSGLVAHDLRPRDYRNGQLGLDGGLGVQLSLGSCAALDLEGKYLRWLGREDGQAPGALQLGGGLSLHFR
jgi:hypothetical protein